MAVIEVRKPKKYKRYKNGRGKMVNKAGRPRAKCDGTANDYRRHLKHGEQPCPESRGAWRTARRRSRQTGVWIADIPYVGIVDKEGERNPR